MARHLFKSIHIRTYCNYCHVPNTNSYPPNSAILVYHSTNMPKFEGVSKCFHETNSPSHLQLFKKAKSYLLSSQL